MDKLSDKESFIEGITFVFGVFLSALSFNLFLNPNNFVVSGFSGIATVLEQVFGWSPSTFLLITNVVLLVVCYFVLGKKETKINLIGSLLYPFMIALSQPLAYFLMRYTTSFDSILVFLFAIITFGVSSGLVYRSGFTTGGSDIIMQIICKYCNVAQSKANVFANAIVIVAGGMVFGVEKAVYSFIILMTSTYFIDKIMFGTSDSKVFYIYTKKIRKVKKVIIEEFQSGFTMIPSKGGYSRKNGLMIMCVVSNNDYYPLKMRINEIDPNAFIIINKCYEVNGGVRRSALPFL